MDKNNQYYFAVDLGATSGRTIIGLIDGGKVTMEELTRFDNPIIHACGHDYWDIMALYREIIRGLSIAAERKIGIRSIGIDTWGCDFAFVGSDGQLLSNPMSYRDPHTEGVMERYFSKAMSRQQVYEKTGIQFMNFNSLFQLYQMGLDGNAALRQADKILFIPDALSYMLTGKAVCEYTVASTSQMLNPVTGDLDEELLASVGLKRSQFGPMTRPGSVVGKLREDLQRITGLGPVPVIAVAGHDTASAVAAVPARNEHFAYLSSGTWSLMGIESPSPIINKESYARNFTNEGGIEGTTRFLKNICGMWIYERLRKEWPGASDKSHLELQMLAVDSEPFRSIINPDAPDFANPESMVTAIDDYCDRTGQPRPNGIAAYCRCVFDSLALRYRQVFEWLKELAGSGIETLHIIGGGSKNEFLDQFTANSCGVEVKAGPQEATALGNIMLQAKACGEVRDIWEMRNIIGHSTDLQVFTPKEKDLWDKAYKKYIEVTKK